MFSANLKQTTVVSLNKQHEKFVFTTSMLVNINSKKNLDQHESLEEKTLAVLKHYICYDWFRLAIVHSKPQRVSESQRSKVSINYAAFSIVYAASASQCFVHTLQHQIFSNRKKHEK